MKKIQEKNHYGTHSGSLEGHGVKGHVIEASDPAGTTDAEYAIPFPVDSAPPVATNTAPPIARSITANKTVTTTFPILFTSKTPRLGVQNKSGQETLKRHVHLVAPNFSRCQLAKS